MAIASSTGTHTPGWSPVPEDEYFTNTVVKNYGILRDRIEIFAKTFHENLKYLSAFSATSAKDEPSKAGDVNGGLQHPKLTVTEPAKTLGETREHLDTCFVLMPFGGYFDSYFEELRAAFSMSLIKAESCRFFFIDDFRSAENLFLTVSI